MKQTKRLGVPLLVTLLVALPLSVGAGGAAAEAPRATTGSIMIPAAAFTPSSNDWEYDNSGLDLITSTGGNFLAPLSFPVPVVNIRRIILYALDNTGAAVCLTLYRSSPATDHEVLASWTCTTDSTDDPQVVSTTAINPKAVNTAVQAPYLWVNLGPGHALYGVKVIYSY